MREVILNHNLEPVVVKLNIRRYNTLVENPYESAALPHRIDFNGQDRGNLSSEHGEPGTCLRVREAPAALPQEGATRAPVMHNE